MRCTQFKNIFMYVYTRISVVTCNEEKKKGGGGRARQQEGFIGEVRAVYSGIKREKTCSSRKFWLGERASGH